MKRKIVICLVWAIVAMQLTSGAASHYERIFSALGLKCSAWFTAAPLVTAATVFMTTFILAKRLNAWIAGVAGYTIVFILAIIPKQYVDKKIEKVVIDSMWLSDGEKLASFKQRVAFPVFIMQMNNDCVIYFQNTAQNQLICEGALKELNLTATPDAGGIWALK
jgi:hypothetical protein